MTSKKEATATITIEIGSWLNGGVLFAAVIAADTPPRLHVRGAVVAAVKARACLNGAYLARAYLTGANLTGASLNGASLNGAILSGAESFDKAICRYQIPQEGELIVWKKVRGGVCKLRVPPEAERQDRRNEGAHERAWAE